MSETEEIKSMSKEDKINTEKWSKEHVIDINKLIYKTKIRKQYHREASQYCKKWANRLELPPILFPIVLAPISSTFDSRWWVVYMNMTGFIVSGLLVAIVKHFSFGDLSKEHIQLSRSYVKLKDNLRTELTKKEEFRTDVTKFISDSYSEFHQLMNTSPLLDLKLYDKVKFKIERNTLQMC